MSRKYINRSGESVEVNDEHLEAALEIMEQLQKASPSRRVSWVNHKRMMQEEGFEDSDSNESYRQMMKFFRKSKGVLPTSKTLASMVSESKLESIKGAIGDLRFAQLETREDFNKLNKLKREYTKDILMVEELTRLLPSLKMSYTEYHPIVKKDETVRKMIAGFSDLHYGYTGQNLLNEYNPFIAEEVVMDYADKLILIGDKENVDEIHVVNLGDLIEGILRNQSMFDTNQTLMEQTVNATNLLIKFLVELSKHFKVKYSAIAGNHDRISKNAKENLERDTIMFVSNAIIKQYAELSNGLIEFVELDDEYFGLINVNGLNIACLHGDRTSVTSPNSLSNLSTMFGVDLDLVIAGHFHKFNVQEVGEGKYTAIFGSFKGIDDYSIRIGKTSERSQGIVLVDEDGEFEIRQVKL